MNEKKIAPKLTNVFVLMLENHSFDNIFAMSRIPGITAATVEDFNFVEGKKYFVQDGAPWCMTTDPGHEFDDVLEQLCGYDAAQSYPNTKTERQLNIAVVANTIAFEMTKPGYPVQGGVSGAMPAQGRTRCPVSLGCRPCIGESRGSRN
jgi:phospholipase C